MAGGQRGYTHLIFLLYREGAWADRMGSYARKERIAISGAWHLAPSYRRRVQVAWAYRRNDLSLQALTSALVPGLLASSDTWNLPMIAAIRSHAPRSLNRLMHSTSRANRVAFPGSAIILTTFTFWRTKGGRLVYSQVGSEI